MPEIANPQVVSFANNDMRVLGDLLTRLNIRSAAAMATYNAADLGTIITAAGPGEFIADGSEVDGRTRCTGGDIFNMATLLNDLATFMTQGRKDVLAKWNVNGGR